MQTTIKRTLLRRVSFSLHGSLSCAVCVCVCVCLCVCVCCMCLRKRETETDRQTETERQRQRQRHTQREGQLYRSALALRSLDFLSDILRIQYPRFRVVCQGKIDQKFLFCPLSVSACLCLCSSFSVSVSFFVSVSVSLYLAYLLCRCHGRCLES